MSQTLMFSPPGVYVDDSPAADALFETAAEHRAGQRLTAAAEVYQQLAEQYGQRLTFIGERLYGDVARAVELRLRDDAALLEAWRRRYEPTAEQAFAAAADDEALTDVIGRYRLTTVGLDAAHRLAGLRLEAGRPGRATVLLRAMDDHPDLQDDGPAAQRHTMLRAAALAMSGRGDKAARLLDEARPHAEDTALAAQVRAVLASSPTAENAQAGAAPNAAEPGSDDLGLLWSLAVPGVPENFVDRRVRQTPGPGGGVGSAYTAALHMAPTVHRSVLYVNSGGAVVALDVHSGREMWRHEHSLAWTQASPLARLQARPAMPDLRGVAVADDRLTAVLGHGALTRQAGGGFGGTTAVVCLRRDDGSLQWQATPDVLAGHGASGGEDFGDAYFHGTPAVYEDLVLVLIRRHGAGNLAAEHLAALDLGDGAVRWIRHIASTAVHDRALNRPPLGSLLVADGLAYVADHLGSVACVELNGRVRWLYAFSTLARDLAEGRALGLSGTAPWRISAPVMLPGGLLAPLPAPSSGAILLDPGEGRKLRDVTGPLWHQPVLAVAVGEDVLLAGRSLARLDGRSLDVKWQTPLPEPMSGRPAAGAGWIAVPLSQQILIVDARDGQVRARWPSVEPGNVATIGEGIVLAGAEHLHGHLPWAVAEAHLRRQIVAATDRAQAADAALSLAHLATNHRRDDVLLWAADAALAAAESATGSHVHHAVFEQLLAITELVDSAPQLAAAVLDRAEKVARGPDATVAYHLRRGSVLEALTQPSLAVEQYQVLLDQPGLSARMTARGGMTRSVRDEAALRIGRLIATAGPGVYARYATIAEQRLTELVPDAAEHDALPRSDEIAALLELARQYPFAPAAGRGLLIASRAIDDEGVRSIGGGTEVVRLLLQDVYDRIAEPSLRLRIASRVAELYEQTEHPLRAAWWVRRMGSDFPESEAWRGGQRISPQSWLGLLAADEPQVVALPRIVAPLHEAIVIPGQPLVPIAMDRAAWPRDVLLTREGGQVAMRRPPTFEPVWRHDVGDGSVELLYCDRRVALLWLDSASRVLTLRMEDGQPAYPVIDLPRVLMADVGDDALALPAGAAPFEPLARDDLEAVGMQQMQAPAPVDPPRPMPQRMPGRMGLCHGAVNAHAAVFVEAGGQALAVETDTGRPLWQRRVPLDHVMNMDVSPRALVVGGLVGREPGKAYTAAVVLDLVTGRELFTYATDPAHVEPLQILRLLADDRLLVGSPTSLRCLDARGRLLWASASADDEQDGMTAWAVVEGSLAMIRTRQPAMRLVALDSGEVLPLPGHLVGNRGDPMDMQAVQGRWHLLGFDHATCLDDRGRMVWRDAVAGPGGRAMLAQWLTDGQVLVLAADVAADGAVPLQPALRWLQPRSLRVPRPPTARGVPAHQQAAMIGSAYHLYFLDAQGGRIVSEQRLDPLAGPLETRRCLAIEGHLVLAAADSSIILRDSAR